MAWCLGINPQPSGGAGCLAMIVQPTGRSGGLVFAYTLCLFRLFKGVNSEVFDDTDSMESVLINALSSG